MSVFVKHEDAIKGAWPRVKTSSGWKTPSRIFVRHQNAWVEILRNAIKVVLGDPGGAETYVHNFNLKEWLIANDLWATRKLRVEVTVLPNTFVTSPFLGIMQARNPKPAFSTGSGWVVGSLVTLKNFGYILGAAGLPGRPMVIVPATDTQNLEQTFAIESRCTKKLSMRVVTDYVIKSAGSNKYFKNYLDISGGVRDHNGVEVGLPTDGGDAVENFATLIIYNYGKIFGGGGGGGSFPHICMANYSGEEMINYNVMGGDSAIRTRKAAAEQAPAMGGFGAGDLRVTEVTENVGISRRMTLPASAIFAPLNSLTNYGRTYACATDSDKWGVNGRLSVTSIYYPPHSSLSVAAYGAKFVARSLTARVRMTNSLTASRVSPTSLKTAPSGFSVRQAVDGGYSTPYFTFGFPGHNVYREYSELSKAGVPIFQVSGGEGGDWGCDGFYAFISHSDHDVHEPSSGHYDAKTGEFYAPPPSHYEQKRRIYKDGSARHHLEGTAVVNEAFSIETYAMTSTQSMTVDVNGFPITFAEYGVPTSDSVGIKMLLDFCFQRIDPHPTEGAYPAPTVVQGAVNEALVAELNSQGNRYSRMMQPGRGGRAVKGAAGVVFATPNNDGSYKGRFE